MFFFFSKILHFLLTPIVWVFILLLLAILLKPAQRKRKFLISAVVVFYFFSNSFIVDEAFRLYEERNQKFDDIAQHDVAIILGGFTTYDNELQLEQFQLSTDRLLHGVQLYKTGKVKKIMLVGGSGSISKPNEKEGPILYKYLVKSGIPARDILVESASKNTHENAVNTAEILENKYPNGKFILVTSGFHMPRAKRCFKKEGVTVTPFSVDQYAGKRKYLLDHLFIPNSFNLSKWEILLHEWSGFVSYKMAGYI